jgi:hypothetical protein
MQSAYLEILKAFIAHLDIPDAGAYIISGCAIVEENITPGMMYIDGELCEFSGSPGTGATKIKKQISVTNLPFKNGSNLPVFRATKAIVAIDGVALSDFIRIQTVKNLAWDNIREKPEGIVLDPNFGIPDTKTLIQRIMALEGRPLANVPIGLVAIWGLPEDDIPDGWVAHYPLAGRLPIGKDTEDSDFDSTVGVGSVGGSKTATLTEANNGPHTHGLNVVRLNVSEPAGSEGVFRGDSEDEQTGTSGEGEAFSIMNPYKVVDYIRYTGL